MSKELAADYFSRHTSDECHITSDGRVFHTLGSAQGFAAGLKDDKVSSYKRGDMEKPTKIVAQNTTSQGIDKEARFKTRIDRLIALGFERNEDLFSKEENGGIISIEADDVYESTDEEFEAGLTPLAVDSTDTSKVQALDAIKNFDASVASYQEIKALVKDLGLDSPSQKEVDLVATIEAYKVIINTEVKE